MQYPICQTRVGHNVTATPRGLCDSFTYRSEPTPPGNRVGQAWFRDEKCDLERFTSAKGGSDAAAGMSVEDVLEELGVTNAPVTRENVEIAMDFIRRHCGHDEQKTLSYLEAMDLSKEVKVITIPSGRVLVGYKDPGHSRRDPNMFGEFFTKSGTSPRDVGINVRDQHFVKYIVKNPVDALMSTTSAYASESQGSGGGVQFIIPARKAAECLSIAHVSASRTGAARR